MKKTLLNIILIGLLFLSSCEPAYSIQNDIDDVVVPPDNFIVEITVNAMPRNMTVGYDLDYDGVADIFFYFPIYEDYGSKAKLTNVDCTTVKHVDVVEKVCRYNIESDLWVLVIEDYYIYRMKKEWTGYRQAVSENDIETVKKTYKDVGKHPDEYYYDEELMDKK